MIAVITPTYDEKDNILILLSRLEHVLSGQDYRIIVIDDNSPDGTGAIVKERQQANDRIVLIERGGKLGYGTAIKAGIQRALALGAERVITLDADLSHPPETINAMLVLPQDVIIGSRYVPGGKIVGWGPQRKLLSATANLVAHWCTGLLAHDTTGGFRCYRRRVFQRVDLTQLTAEGYSFLMEMLWRCQRAGATITEVPITFTNRTHGSSKISSREIWRALQTIGRLMRWRMGRPRQK